MKVLAAGFMRMAGKSDKSGSNYDMALLKILVPMTSFQNGKMQRVAAGFETADVEIGEGAWHHFVSLPYPCHVELTVTEEMRTDRNGKAEFRKVAIGATFATGIDISDPVIKAPVNPPPLPSGALKAA